MASVPKIIISIIWLPQAIGQLLLWVYWWQVKEYRHDRFRSFVKSSAGRGHLRLLITFLKIVLLFISIFSAFTFWIAIIPIICLDIEYLIGFLRKNLRRPVFTQRGKRIVWTGALLILIVFIVSLFYANQATPIFIGELSLLFAPLLGILWTTPIVNKVKKRELEAARRKLVRINPVVIGITGSYGKTTTKDFIATLLSQKYKVEKTHKNMNTDFGIARKVINDFRSSTQVFVVEMGAYKSGDVENLCGIVNPKLGVITGIEPQHTDLFGGIEKIKQTKFELIRALPEDGTAIFNLSNPYNTELFGQARKLSSCLKVLGYSMTSNVARGLHGDVRSKVSRVDDDGIYFDVYYKGQKKNFYTPLFGVHFIENLTGAILVARELGLNWKQIAKGVKNVHLPKGIMTRVKLPYGALLIDDTYNATPKGFESAISTLEQIKGRKKVIVTSGIIELGKYEKRVHRRIGRKASFVDKIIVATPQLGKYIEEGAGSKERVELVDDSRQLIKKVERFVEEGCVILLEGRMPSALMKFIDKRKK